MVLEQHQFGSYREGLEVLQGLGFRTIGGLGDYIFPSRDDQERYLDGLPEVCPASCIPWPVGKLKHNGIFEFDDSTNLAVEAYKQRVRDGLGIDAGVAEVEK